MNKCAYNLELLILATARTPWQDYNEPIKKDSAANYIYQLKDTDIDTVMICPTAWKRPLWPSKIDSHWTTDATKLSQPLIGTDMKYHEKAYFRLREYMMQGNDPVDVAVKAAKETGIAPFISYRMNDHHYLNQPDAFIHPAIWRNNPSFWIGDGDRHFDYINQEVRDYYFSLLNELVDNYDIDGLELDFMRSPIYFHKNNLADGIIVMTGFVRKIRNMLDEYGAKRNKRLSLCVRVPNTIEAALEIGLDVATWDSEGLIDIINISSFFMNSPNLDIESYKNKTKNATLLGEMHFIIDSGEIYNGFKNNVSRKTTAQIYRSLAANYLDRGADGVSMFNIDYTRHHFFNEPRRLKMKDGQPPTYAFRGITDPDYLSKCDKHYFVGPHYSTLPQSNNLDIDLYVADKTPADTFKHSILRLKTQRPCQPIDIATYINGVKLEEISWLGELFAPISNEALPRREFVKCFLVPTSIITHGYNKITAVNTSGEIAGWDMEAIFDMVELALYKENSFLSAE